MKLTGLLKDKVEAVETKEEKKAIISEAGMELTDEELEGIAGGYDVQDRFVYKLAILHGECYICGKNVGKNVMDIKNHFYQAHGISVD